jgi:hypothetical protein
LPIAREVVAPQTVHIETPYGLRGDLLARHRHGLLK